MNIFYFQKIFICLILLDSEKEEKSAFFYKKYVIDLIISLVIQEV